MSDDLIHVFLNDGTRVSNDVSIATPCVLSTGASCRYPFELESPRLAPQISQTLTESSGWQFKNTGLVDVNGDGRIDLLQNCGTLGRNLNDKDLLLGEAIHSS